MSGQGKPMPSWLRQHLISTGRLDADRITRKARARLCGKCRSPIMVGLDADRCGFVARCDVASLTPDGEILATVAGRATYNLRWVFDRYNLHRRGAIEIAAHPARSQAEVDVVAEHQCGAPDLPAAESLIKPQLSSAALPDEPPF